MKHAVQQLLLVIAVAAFIAWLATTWHTPWTPPLR